MALRVAPDSAALEATLEAIDLTRLRLSRQVDATRRADMGQFLSPVAVTRQLAAMFPDLHGDVRILDPGAGIGSLGAALVCRLLSQAIRPTSVSLTAVDVDARMRPALTRTMEALLELCRRSGVQCEYEIRICDFLAVSVDQISGDLFEPAEQFNAVIMNPPYRKIATKSVERTLCRRIGLETSNLYAAFLAVATRLLVPGGHMVAIVPRSFANGTYFAPFRRQFTTTMAFRQLHLYETRHRAFYDDAVLQENVVLAAIKTDTRPDVVTITSSTDPTDLDPTYREVRYDDLIRPTDTARVVHIVADGTNQRIADRVASLPATLADLDLDVSTGPVVDFRAADYLREHPGADTAPLIYPGHIRAGRVAWPRDHYRKPNALLLTPGSLPLLVPEGLYIITKRFSSKEERRRIVAALYDPADVAPGPVGLENHLNYFHSDGQGLDREVAIGLCAYLNSTLVDLHFRQFSGHTQVNAGDLRRLRYPSREQLVLLAHRIGERHCDQAELDDIIDKELFMAADHQDPVRVGQRVNEAMTVLRQLGLPRGQLNDRSALTLLALLDLGPEDPWANATNPLRGITPMMDHFRDHYGKTYAPNTRETVRRQTVHQFLDAGLLIINPDAPARPTNSPRAAYQIETSTLELLRTIGTPAWSKNLEVYLGSRTTLREKYAAERRMSRIPVMLPGGGELSLSGGGQNVLVKRIIDEFCSRWTPGGDVIYVGDTDDKFALYDADGLRAFGVSIDQHGKMPDVIVHDVARDWLILIEAVTSHGPVDAKRRGELSALFHAASIPLVYVTAFLDRQAMTRYLTDIAWETEVWCADDPSHLIHFNGERYLGPYDQ